MERNKGNEHMSGSSALSKQMPANPLSLGSTNLAPTHEKISLRKGIEKREALRSQESLSDWSDNNVSSIPSNNGEELVDETEKVGQTASSMDLCNPKKLGNFEINLEIKGGGESIDDWLHGVLKSTYKLSKCALCNRRVKNIDQHQQIMHYEEGQNIPKCFRCGAVMQSEQIAQLHLLQTFPLPDGRYSCVALAKPPYRCPSTVNVYKSKTDFKRHISQYNPKRTNNLSTTSVEKGVEDTGSDKRNQSGENAASVCKFYPEKSTQPPLCSKGKQESIKIYHEDRQERISKASISEADTTSLHLTEKCNSKTDASNALDSTKSTFSVYNRSTTLDLNKRLKEGILKISRHQKNQMKTTVTKSKYCLQCRKYQANLQVHQLIRHSLPGKEIRCPICSESFPTEMNAMYHVYLSAFQGCNTYACSTGKICKVKRPKRFPTLSCLCCGKTYSQPYNLRTHMKAVHGVDYDINDNAKKETFRILNDKDKVLSDETISRLCSLYHFFRAMAVKRLYCNICKEIFLASSTLSSHRRKFHGIYNKRQNPKMWSSSDNQLGKQIPDSDSKKTVSPCTSKRIKLDVGTNSPRGVDNVGIFKQTNCRALVEPRFGDEQSANRKMFYALCLALGKEVISKQLTSIKKMSRMVDTILDSKQCPVKSCDVVFWFRKQLTRIGKVGEVVQHILAAHNPTNNPNESALFSSLTLSDASICEVCQVDNTNEHRQLHRTLADLTVHHFVPRISSLSRFMELYPNASPALWAAFLKEITFRQRMVDSKVILVLYLPFRARCLEDVYVKLRRNEEERTTAKIGFNVMLGRNAKGVNAFDLFPEADRFYVFGMTIYDPNLQSGIKSEQQVRVEYAKAYLKVMGKLHLNKKRDIFDHVRFQSIGTKKHLKRLETKLKWITEQDIDEVFDDIYDIRCTIFCLQEFINVNGLCNDPSCRALVHKGSEGLLLRRRNYRDKSILLVNSVMPIRETLFFRLNAPLRTEEEQRNYRQDFKNFIRSFKDKLQETAYVVAVSNEDTQMPQPNQGYFVLRGRQLEGKYLLYAGRSKRLGMSDAHWQPKIGGTNLAKAYSKGLWYTWCVYQNPSDHEVVEVTEALWQLTGKLYQLSSNPLKNRFVFINDRLEWAQLGLTSYDVLVDFFAKVFSERGIIFANNEENVDEVVDFFQNNIVLERCEKNIISYGHTLTDEHEGQPEYVISDSDSDDDERNSDVIREIDEEQQRINEDEMNGPPA